MSRIAAGKKSLLDPPKVTESVPYPDEKSISICKAENGYVIKNYPKTAVFEKLEDALKEIEKYFA